MPAVNRALLIVLCASLELAAGRSAIAGDARPGADVRARMGDGTVSAARLKPYDNAFVVTLTYENGTRDVIGVWTDQLRLRTIDGRGAMVRVQGIVSYSGTTSANVNVFDPVTFAPFSDIIHAPNGRIATWTVSGRDVEGRFQGSPNAAETARTFRTEELAYDLNCCMRSLLPAAVHLFAGETFTVPSIAMNDGDPSTVTFTVLRRESIRAGRRGMVDAWVVRTPGPVAGDITFWIGDDPPYVLREALTGIPQNRSAAGLHFDMSFDMID